MDDYAPGIAYTPVFIVVFNHRFLYADWNGDEDGDSLASAALEGLVGFTLRPEMHACIHTFCFRERQGLQAIVMRDPFFAFDAMSISNSYRKWSSRDGVESRPAVKMRPSVEGLAESGFPHSHGRDRLAVYGVVRCALSMAQSGSYGS